MEIKYDWVVPVRRILDIAPGGAMIKRSCQV